MEVRAGVGVGVMAAACWLCWWIAVPRSALPAFELAMATYARVIGRQCTLLALALALSLLSGLVSVLSRPAPINPDLAALRFAHAECGGVPRGSDQLTCIELAPGGVWVVEKLDDDGRWRVVTTLPGRPRIKSHTPEDCYAQAPGDC